MALIRTPCDFDQETLTVCHEGEILCCDAAADVGWAVSGGWDGRLMQWDRKTGSPLSQWSGGAKPITACRIAPDGKAILTGSMDGLFCQWDAEKRDRQTIFLAHTRPISCITHSPDAKTVATASWDQTLNLWQVDKERERRTLLGHGDIVAGCKFLPDNKHLLSWSHDQTLKLWDTVRGRTVATLRGHEDRITAADVAPNGKWFVSSGRDNNVILWDAASHSEASRYSHQRGEIVACVFSPDAELVFLVSSKGEVLTRTVPDFQNRSKQTTGYALHVAALAASGEQLLMGSHEGRLHFVPVEGMRERAICVTAQETHEHRPKFMDRLLGREAMQRVLRCSCPICHVTFEIHAIAADTTVCPDCKKRLHLNTFTLFS